MEALEEALNTKADLKRLMKPGTTWTRVNHRFPNQVGGERIAEKGEPVQVTVHRQLGDSIEFAITGHGEPHFSYLSWPDSSNGIWMQTRDNEIRIEDKYGVILTYTRNEPAKQEAQQLVGALLDENLDSLEGGVDAWEEYYKGREYMREPWYREMQARQSGKRLRKSQQGQAPLQFRPTPSNFQSQWPVKPEWHPGHRSARMSTGRNVRRKSFGYPDHNYSLRDRQWPYANRGFDAQTKKYNRALNRFGQVEPGEGI